MKKFNKKRLKLLVVFSVLITFLLIAINNISFTQSRFETEIASNSALNTAIYLLNDQYQVVNVKLPDVIPSNNQYKYTFSISNYNNTKHAETTLAYDLSIRTTTNMPIEYDLYETLDITNAPSIITSNTVTLDADGTYFRHIETSGGDTFAFDEDCINNYTLLFTFPSEYNDEVYQSLIDYIEIKVDSHQVLSTD